MPPNPRPDRLGPIQRRRLAPLRETLAQVLPAEQSADIGDADWAILAAFVAGTDPEDLATQRGVTAQRVMAALTRAFKRLVGVSARVWLLPNGTPSPLAVEPETPDGCIRWRGRISDRLGPTSTLPPAFQHLLPPTADSGDLADHLGFRYASVRQVLYELAHGPVPPDVTIMATCGDPLCVAVAHARVVPKGSHQRVNDRVASHAASLIERRAFETTGEAMARTGLRRATVQHIRRGGEQDRTILFRRRLAEGLPVVRPTVITPRRWERVRRFVAGESIPAIAAADGVTRQMVWVDVQALANLAAVDPSHLLGHGTLARDAATSGGPGLSAREVAERLGVSDTTVRSRARRLGLGRRVGAAVVYEEDDIGRLRTPDGLEQPARAAWPPPILVPEPTGDGIRLAGLIDEALERLDRRIVERTPGHDAGDTR